MKQELLCTNLDLDKLEARGDMRRTYHSEAESYNGNRNEQIASLYFFSSGGGHLFLRNRDESSHHEVTSRAQGFKLANDWLFQKG